MSRPPIFASLAFADALAEATAAGKLLVLDATASWCQPCQTMDRTTWADAKVVAWLGEHAVAIQVDVDAEKEIAATLRIRSMPTVVAFRAGTEFDRVVGMKGPGDLIAWLDAVKRGETSVDQLRRGVAANAGDMHARMSLARALAASRRFEEATDEYVWLWEHVLEHQPAMVGVRGSFMLNEITKLAEDHPPARARFAELRNSLDRDDVKGMPLRSDMTDWMDLSKALGEEELVLTWFDSKSDFVNARPELARVLRHRLVPLLVARDRWADVSRLFPDPMGALRAVHESLDQVRGRVMPEGMEALRPQMVLGVEKMLRNEGALMIASLRAAGREAEATAVTDEVRRLLPGEETDRAIADTARKAGLDEPTA